MEIMKLKISDIKNAEYNPRKDLKPGDKEYEKLKKSILEFGYVDPLVWNKETGNIVGGHQRIKILKEMGYEEVECSVVSLSKEKEAALNIALNKISGEWDLPKLKDLLVELDTGEFDIEITGFDETELAVLLSDVGDDEVKEDDFNEKEAVEKALDTTITSGDVYILGQHRLICGDSTDSFFVKKLMDGYSADMCFTDPPYNVDYTGKTKDSLKIKNDKMSDDQFRGFLEDAFSRAYEVMKPGAPIYICHADSEGINFRSAMVASGFELKQCIIWVKDVLVMGRQDHHWKHEPILYGWKKGGSHKWYGGRKQTTVIDHKTGIAVEEKEDGFVLNFNVENGKSAAIKVKQFEVIHPGEDEQTTIWRVPKPARNGQHPTMKPISLVARALKNSSREGDVVLDLFGGSGSTLMACEEMKRHARVVEFDPVYCQVIIDRWEKFTGKKAVKIG
ncbi:site-specific DNA-methyltransferase [Alicyclobacillus tolerans]|uniref:site-specific DNA-methyltransferase n=1 Tax=Alicyclobacillus tolerans TaxID=90970 RepID=UPI003B7D37BC